MNLKKQILKKMITEAYRIARRNQGARPVLY
jgi:hypothetical protein